MKVLLINGSPHEKGSTYTALSKVTEELESRGVEAEIFHIGAEPIRGCIACKHCRETGSGRCVFDDVVNIALEKAKDCDGFVFGSPVYYASANGALISFLDRLFYCQSGYFAYKPAASISVARRAGTTATYDQLNKYIGLNKMIMVPSVYWNMAFGHNAEEVRQDEEGMRIMSTIGKNMAWMLKVLEAGKKEISAEPM